MCIESLICRPDQLTIETALTTSGFVAGYQENCLPIWIERECNAPYSICGREAQFLHIGVLRILQRINVRTS